MAGLKLTKNHLETAQNTNNAQYTYNEETSSLKCQLSLPSNPWRQCQQF